MSGVPPHDGDDSAPAGGDRRPGPDLLYSDPVTPPQFETWGIWEADPLLVSGTEAHVDAEYLYQDYVYDDKGASTGETTFPPSPEPPQPVPNPSLVSHSTGRLVYPTDDETYGHNAADLLEFRTRATDGGVAYRLTLQTMLEPDAAAVAIGIDTGGDGGRTDWGYGIGELGELDLDHVLVAWGTGAELDGEPVPSDDVSVDAERNQIEVTIPLQPGEETWRHYCAVGLWDDEAGEFRQVADQPTEDRPGGAHGDSPPPIFNVGFRFDEPMGVTEATSRVPGMPPGRERDTATYGMWREHAQAGALAERDISDFHADVDYGALAAGAGEADLLETGYSNRLYASRYDVGEGVRKDFGMTSDDRPSDDRSKYDLLKNRVQPYALYVPESYGSLDEHPLVVHCHGGSASYNTLGTRQGYYEQVGEDRDALVLVPEGRGPGVFYQREGELDVLEAMADVIARYDVDLNRITVSGVSMGGHGAFRFSSRYPDLFSKAFPVVGSYWPGDEAMLDSLRHVPVLMYNGLVDDLAIPADFLPAAVGLQQRGYRHELDMFVQDGHLDAVQRDEWDHAREFMDGKFLGEGTVTRDPDRVTYTRMPDMESPDLDLVHDGAYWVEGIEIADGAGKGTVDVAVGATPDSRHYAEYREEPAGHAVIGTRWTDDESDAPAGDLHLDLDDVTGLTVDLDGAGLADASTVEVTVEATHEATVRLRGESTTAEVAVGPGTDDASVSLGD